MKEKHHVEYLTAALAATLLTTVISTICVAESRSGEARPNILWLTAEDIGTELGCYGDEYAKTPCIDQLSTRGLRYLTAWSNAPVCAGSLDADQRDVSAIAGFAPHAQFGAHA